ncbi:ATP-binding protein [Sulfurimonas sp.]|uniref:sensor histidine kinase n=1 Tax=Sulfurimonas sp. TaxID=2022749 RepID=UPI003D0AC396
MINLDFPLLMLLGIFAVFFGISFLFFLISSSKKDKELSKLRQEISILKGEIQQDVQPNTSTKSHAGMQTSLISEQLKKIEHLENEVQRQKDKVEEAKFVAQEAVKVKYDFLSNIKEDLLSPIKTIIAYASILSKNIQSEKLNRYAKDIITSSEELLKSISNMVALSKIDAGNYDIQENAVELAFLFNGIVDEYKHVVSRKGIEFTLDIDKSLPESLIFDAPKVKAIVENLVSNSIKATKKGYINIYVRANGKDIAHNTMNLQVIVEDSGTGIQKEDQSKIFEMFETEGLGLALNKKVAKLMHGDLTFYSEYGKGASFILSLSNVEIVLPSAEDEFHELDINFAQIAPEGASVMVIESDQGCVDTIVESFMQSHVRVVHFQTPREAIEELKKVKYDLLFINIDILTTDENAISKVIAKISNAPVVTLTNSNIKEFDISEKGAKIVAHLKKPLSRRELFKISIKVLNFPEMLKNIV